MKREKRIRREPVRFILSFASLGFAFWDVPSRTGRFIFLSPEQETESYDLDEKNPAHRAIIRRLVSEGEKAPAPGRRQ